MTFNALPCPPNDPLYHHQDALDTINVPQAWCQTTGAPNIVIAVIDGGFEVGHEDLKDSLWVNPLEDVNGNGKPDYLPVSQGGDLDGLDGDGNGKVDDLAGWDFEDNDSNLENSSHGTRVAGIVGATRNNSKGIGGIAGGNGSTGGCSLMLIRYDSIVDFGYALSYAIDNGAHVINLSGGWENEVSTAWLRYGIDNFVYVLGKPFVAAAGNNTPTPIQFPAAYDSTIAVGSIFSDLSFGNTSFGAELDFVAVHPIHTTLINGGYGPTGEGSSFTAPQVSGVIGLMLSVNPYLNQSAIRSILEDSSIKLPGMGGADWHSFYGFGTINALERNVSIKMRHESSKIREQGFALRFSGD